MNILLVLILYALVFAGSEIIYHYFKMSFLFSRKFAHVFGSIVSFFLPIFISNMEAVYIGLLFTLAIYFFMRKNVFKSIHDMKGQSIGEVVFPLGMALSALFIWPVSIVAYQSSCLVIGLSDGIAGYIGSKYGKRNFSYFKGEKTKEGSLIFFIITLIIFSSFYVLFGPAFSLQGAFEILFYALILTIVEAIFYGGWDNFIIPITSGVLLLSIIF